MNWFRMEFLGQHSEGRFRRQAGGENELMWEGGRGKSATTLQVRSCGEVGGEFRCLESQVPGRHPGGGVLIRPFIHALLIKPVIHSPSNYCGPPVWGRSCGSGTETGTQIKALSIRMRRSAG